MKLALIEEAVSAFQSSRDEYDRFSKLLRGFLEARLLDAQKQFRSLPLLHSVTCRVKTVDSLRHKLVRWSKGKRFATGRIKLDTIDDLAGVRVIFYFKDDMERFLSDDFGLLFGRRTMESVDKKSRPVDSFGYQSVHFTVSHALDSLFTESLRTEDKERFKSFKAEVQVRTILQHAWAETAHDLLYKRVHTGTRTFQEVQAERLYNAMAATLELLDERLIGQKQLLTSFTEHTYSPSKAPKRPRLHNQTMPAVCTHQYLGKVYPYTILHDGDLAALKFEEDPILFDSSTTFGVPNYKEHVWAYLLKKSPDFVRSLGKQDAICVRVKSWNKKKCRLILQPAVYSDQITTNHGLAHDCIISGTKVRDHAFSSNKLLSLADSPMANTIGVSLVIRTSENYWVVARRRKGLSVFSEQRGCPVSGVVQWREPGCWEPNSFRAWMQNSVLIKCDQELGIMPDEKLLVYLGLTREAQRLGKPQIFFLLDLFGNTGGHSAGYIASRYRIYRRDDEYSTLEFLEPNVVDQLVGSVSRMQTEQEQTEQFSSELLMNLALAHRHISRSSQPPVT